VTLTPITGRDAAAQLFDRAAGTIADFGADLGDPTATAAAATDLPGAIVDLTTAPLAAQIAARVLEAQDATTHALLDIVA